MKRSSDGKLSLVGDDAINNNSGKLIKISVEYFIKNK
jgi:hypothetical protein